MRSGAASCREWRHGRAHVGYRKRDRSRPIIGDRRKPSALGDIQPEHWPHEYTTDLLDLLNVLGRLVALEPKQAALLDDILAGRMIDSDRLTVAGSGSPPDAPES